MSEISTHCVLVLKKDQENVVQWREGQTRGVSVRVVLALTSNILVYPLGQQQCHLCHFSPRARVLVFYRGLSTPTLSWPEAKERVGLV